MTNIDIVKEFYAAINRNDIMAALARFDPQILRVEFEGSPMAATFRGLTEMRTHFEKARSTWAEGACTPERFETVGDKILVSVHVRVRLVDAQDWLEGSVSDVFVFRGGKIIEFRSFSESEDALKYASQRF